MKRIEYICNRCSKSIDSDELYSISPHKLDPENEGIVLDMQEEIQDELFELLDDKHLCLDCLKKTLKFFNAPAVFNDIEGLIIRPPLEQQEKPADEPKILPVLDIETVKKLQEEGMTVNEMAVFFGETYNKLYKWMMRRGLITKTYKKELVQEKKELVQDKKKLVQEKARPEKEEIKKIEKEVRPFNSINNLSKNITRAKLDENIPSPKAVEAFKRKAFY